MELLNYYGFSVDKATGRVYLVKDKTTNFEQGIPHNSDNITTGTDAGVVVQKTTKVGVDAQNNLVYNDLKGKPYAGKVTMYGNLPHDEQGRLLVDTVGAITTTYKMLGFTANGAVAMDPKEVPDAPKLNNAYPAKDSIVLDFDETGDEPKFYTGYAVSSNKVFTAEVYDPDEDMVILGLTNGTIYECFVTATSADGVSSPVSNKISAKCESVIPAPVFTSITAGDGFATVTYKDIVAPEPWTVDHYAYSAIDMDHPKDPAIEGHIENGKIELKNDITYYVRICAVCNPGRVPGDFSDAMTVTPEKPSVPYKPKINTCYAQPNGQILVEWSKGANGNRSQSAMTVDSWKVRFKSTDGKGTDFTVNVPTPTPTKILSDKVTIGSWDVFVSGHNSLGWSPESDGANVSYNPAVEDPLIGGQSFSDATYKYCIFYSNATTGYEARRTEEGRYTTFEVLMVGAGGAGKGQTVTFGKGGNGGGGELVITTLPVAYPGSIFVTVPNGSTQSGVNPDNTTVKEGSTILTANAGKSASNKDDAQGYPKTEVPVSWQKLQQFWWNEPGSHYVGGVATEGEQNYPNNTFCGQGGAGTKDNRAGKGGESYVAIRWKK